MASNRTVYHVVPDASAEVKVHKADGNMDYESTYGDDPSRSPG